MPSFPYPQLLQHVDGAFQFKLREVYEELPFDYDGIIAFLRQLQTWVRDAQTPTPTLASDLMPIWKGCLEFIHQMQDNVHAFEGGTKERIQEALEFIIARDIEKQETEKKVVHQLKDADIPELAEQEASNPEHTAQKELVKEERVRYYQHAKLMQPYIKAKDATGITILKSEIKRQKEEAQKAYREQLKELTSSQLPTVVDPGEHFIVEEGFLTLSQAQTLKAQLPLLARYSADKDSVLKYLHLLGPVVTDEHVKFYAALPQHLVADLLAFDDLRRLIKGKFFTLDELKILSQEQLAVLRFVMADWKLYYVEKPSLTPQQNQCLEQIYRMGNLGLSVRFFVEYSSDWYDRDYEVAGCKKAVYMYMATSSTNSAKIALNQLLAICAAASTKNIIGSAIRGDKEGLIDGQDVLASSTVFLKDVQLHAIQYKQLGVVQYLYEKHVQNTILSERLALVIQGFMYAVQQGHQEIASYLYGKIAHSSIAPLMGPCLLDVVMAGQVGMARFLFELCPKDSIVPTLPTLLSVASHLTNPGMLHLLVGRFGEETKPLLKDAVKRHDRKLFEPLYKAFAEKYPQERQQVLTECLVEALKSKHYDFADQLYGMMPEKTLASLGRIIGRSISLAQPSLFVRTLSWASGLQGALVPLHRALAKITARPSPSAAATYFLDYVFPATYLPSLMMRVGEKLTFFSTAIKLTTLENPCKFGEATKGLTGRSNQGPRYNLYAGVPEDFGLDPANMPTCKYQPGKRIAMYDVHIDSNGTLFSAHSPTDFWSNATYAARWGMMLSTVTTLVLDTAHAVGVHPSRAKMLADAASTAITLALSRDMSMMTPVVVQHMIEAMLRNLTQMDPSQIKKIGALSGMVIAVGMNIQRGQDVATTAGSMLINSMGATIGTMFAFGVREAVRQHSKSEARMER